jgi:hypothetical protein
MYCYLLLSESSIDAAIVYRNLVIRPTFVPTATKCNTAKILENTCYLISLPYKWDTGSNLRTRSVRMDMEVLVVLVCFSAVVTLQQAVRTMSGNECLVVVYRHTFIIHNMHIHCVISHKPYPSFFYQVFVLCLQQGPTLSTHLYLMCIMNPFLIVLNVTFNVLGIKCRVNLIAC